MLQNHIRVANGTAANMLTTSPSVLYSSLKVKKHVQILKDHPTLSGFLHRIGHVEKMGESSLQHCLVVAGDCLYPGFGYMKW
jgi:hypothetical protein